jgi:Mn-dependent DtxR family transcriptional regulator
MTIRELLEAQGYARVTDIAKRLNITRGSCSISLKPLKKRGLVVEDHNRFLALSDEGRRMAQLVEENDKLLETFFREVLGVNKDQAEIDACKIEHLLSIEGSVKLAAFIKAVQSGNKVVKDFLKYLKKETSACTRDLQNCPVCDKVCFFKTSLSPRR